MFSMQYLINTLNRLKTENDIATQISRFVFSVDPTLYNWLLAEPAKYLLDSLYIYWLLMKFMFFFFFVFGTSPVAVNANAEVSNTS